VLQRGGGGGGRYEVLSRYAVAFHALFLTPRYAPEDCHVRGEHFGRGGRKTGGTGDRRPVLHGVLTNSPSASSLRDEQPKDGGEGIREGLDIENTLTGYIYGVKKGRVVWRGAGVPGEGEVREVWQVLRGSEGEESNAVED